jgi:murein DD-endopeptidase MepM/ murein hydrolase activator NlpD
MLLPRSVSTLKHLGFLSGIFLGALSPDLAIALEVQISPSAPELGDTISIVVDSPTDTNPQLWVDNQTHPLYSVAPGRFRALVPTTPLDTPGLRSFQVQAEGQVQQHSVAVADRYFTTQHIWLSEADNALTGTDLEFDLVGEFKQLVTPDKFWTTPLRRPTTGPVTTVYGLKRYYNGVFANDYYHRGVDYAAATGTPVIAPAAGRIALVGYEVEGFEIHGNTIGLDHGQGVVSIFIHLNSIQVTEGQMVAAGEQIGTVGSTGISTGPHLHWGLYVHGQAVDPVPWRFGNVE